MFGKGKPLAVSAVSGRYGPRPKQTSDAKGSGIAFPANGKEGIAPSTETPEPDRIFIVRASNHPRAYQPVDDDGYAAMVAVRVDAERREQATWAKVPNLRPQVSDDFIHMLCRNAACVAQENDILRIDAEFPAGS